MKADLLRWDVLVPGKRLFLAHLRGDAAARDLLGGRGSDDAAVAAAVEERRRIPLPHRAALARAVSDRLADPRAVVVVGGQQPGVAGGPLLAFAKALGVVALAERLEKSGAGPVIPVWWVASEDHDLAEAGDVLLGPGKSGAGLLAGVPADRRMLSEVPAPGREAILDALTSGPGRPTEDGRGAVEHLLPGEDRLSLGAQTAGIFRELLGSRGLVVVEPAALRPFARQVFERDVREPGALAAAVREGNARVRAAGFAPVLDDPEGPLHFRVDGSGRRSRGGGIPADLEALGTRISADVVLRVLAQDAALPVAAQVCGPTEVEYLAAIHPVRALVVGFTPCAVPRPGVTILEKRVAEALRDFGADLAGLYRDGEGALHAPAAGDAPLAADSRRLRAELERAAGDPASLPAAVRSRLGRARDGLEDLASAVERAELERRGIGESRRRKVLDALLPDGVPQERKWSLLPFLFRHGPDLWGSMVEALSGPEPGHRVIRI